MRFSSLTPSFLLAILTTAIAILAFLFLPNQIPLWYSLAIPEQQLVPKFMVFLFPGGIWLITLIHLIIAARLNSLDAVIVRIFAYATTLINLLLLVGLIHLIYIFL